MPPYWPQWVNEGTTRIESTWPHWVEQNRTVQTARTINPWNTWIALDPATQNANPSSWYVWTSEPATNLESTCARDVWRHWQTATYVGIVGNAQASPPPLSPEEQAAREAKRKRDDLIRRNRNRAREMRRRIAERTAERLLLEHLDDTQRKEWEVGKAFHVETANGRRRYKIERGLAGNVKLVKCDEPPPVRAGVVRAGSKFCAHVYHPDGWVPHEDNVLAQKLLLESDGGEEVFLTMANVS